MIKLGIGIWGLCSRSTGRNIWGAAQKPDLHAASYALQTTSSLEVEFHFLLVATLGGGCGVNQNLEPAYVALSLSLFTFTFVSFFVN